MVGGELKAVSTNKENKKRRAVTPSTARYLLLVSAPYGLDEYLYNSELRSFSAEVWKLPANWWLLQTAVCGSDFGFLFFFCLLCLGRTAQDAMRVLYFFRGFGKARAN